MANKLCFFLLLIVYVIGTECNPYHNKFLDKYSIGNDFEILQDIVRNKEYNVKSSNFEYYYTDDKYNSEETTTPEGKTTEPYPIIECKEGQSYFTRGDLSKIIDVVVQNLKIVENINSSQYDVAISVRNKHMNNWKHFLERFENRPQHLKHILEEMSQTRQRELEPALEKIYESLKIIPDMEEMYDQILNKGNQVFDKFEHYKKICALNCDVTSLEYRSQYRRKRSRKPLRATYFCSTLEELNETVSSVLLDFQNKFIVNITDNLNNYDNDVGQHIEMMKEKLVEMAVQQFGHIMYDILALQDGYNHFSDMLKSLNVPANISDTKKKLAQIDMSIMELEDNIEVYRKYCLTCNNKQALTNRHYLSPSYTSMLSNYVKNDGDDMLQELLGYKIIAIYQVIGKEYGSIFHELNQTVYDKNTLEINLAKLQPIREYIENKIAYEDGEQIRHPYPQSSLESLSKISNGSTDLLNRLEDAIKFIADKVNI